MNLKFCILSLVLLFAATSYGEEFSFTEELVDTSSESAVLPEVPYAGPQSASCLRLKITTDIFLIGSRGKFNQAKMIPVRQKDENGWLSRPADGLAKNLVYLRCEDVSVYSRP